MLRRIVAVAALVLALTGCGGVNPLAGPAAPATSDAVSIGNLKITNVWVRATPSTDTATPATTAGTDMGGAVGAAYMTITNSSATPDKLVDIAGTVARSFELHTMDMNNGVMEMRPVDGVEVPAGSSVELKPGSLHVMLIDVNQNLRPGDTITLTLTFEKAGTIDVAADVRALQ